ncbi:hypothetical protein PGT21_027587 [Puccinia graminis f. sp. tritici]|uniref:Uncharacterized protein n=2 Tax=Puccinia graminis f. sp. tritici TaxID=56615 RepID=A0A5B0M7X0_PUCGR|nr:hypothetical protein PGT21_027587 [Puccinia graminis f. sp. tritici]
MNPLFGFNARQQRSQASSNGDSPSFDSGRWDSYQTALISENPGAEPLATVWLEASACKRRLALSSTASTLESNSARHHNKFISSSCTSTRYYSFEQPKPSSIFSEMSCSQRGPGQARNFSNASLPIVQRTGRVKLPQVVKPARRKNSDPQADDSTRPPKPPTPSKSIRIPLKYPRAQLSTPTPPQSNHQLSRYRTQSLSCLKSTRDPNPNEDIDENPEMLSAAFFLPKLSMEPSVVSCTTTPGWKKPIDDNINTCLPDASRSLTTASSFDFCNIPSTRQPHSDGLHSPQAYTPPCPSGFQTWRPSLSEYHHSAVTHEDETIQDPCNPGNSNESQSSYGYRFSSSGGPDIGSATYSSTVPRSSHSSSGSQFSFISVYRSPESFNSQTRHNPCLPSEPPRHLRETQSNQINPHIVGIHSHTCSSTQQLELLCSTKKKYPSLSLSSAQPNPFPSFGQKPRSSSKSITYAPGDYSIGFVDIEKPLKTSADMHTPSPYQREMLDIMAIHGESIFKPPVSTELMFKRHPSPCEEPSVHYSMNSSAEPSPKYRTLLKSSPRSDTFTQKRIERVAPLDSETLVGSGDDLQSGKTHLINQAEKSEPTTPLLPLFKSIAPSPRECRLKKIVLPIRPSTAGASTRSNGFPRRLSQSSRNKPPVEQHDPQETSSKKDKFEALLKASDASNGGTMKLSLSSKIDSIDESLHVPSTFLPQLRFSCESSSLTARRSSDCETRVTVNSSLKSKRSQQISFW